MWDNADDAVMRINQSVVMYDGEPVFIRDVDRDCVASFTNLISGERRTAQLANPKWDWKPVPMGYINLGDKTVYSCRKPIRKWKQGLHRDNVMLRPERQAGMGDIIRTKEFGACVMGKYPQFGVAMAKCKDGTVQSIAFDRKFALKVTDIGLIFLKHAGNTVGWYDKAGQLEWGAGMEYHKEMYEEAIA